MPSRFRYSLWDGTQEVATSILTRSSTTSPTTS